MPHSSREIITRLRRAGFEHLSQKESHLKLRGIRGGASRTVIVRHAADEVPEGTFASILKQVGLSRSELESLR